MSVVYAPVPEVSVLRSLLKLDHEEGRLFWIGGRCGVVAGSEAGNQNSKGYRRIKVVGRLLLAHRIIFKMHYGIDPGQKEVDHIDCDPRNNRPENLRLAIHGQNQTNGRAFRNNKTGFRGVHWHKQHRKYCVSIQHKGRREHCGLFTSATEAARCYNLKAAELFGEFARLNILEP